jgi:Zn-dependent protease
MNFVLNSPLAILLYGNDPFITKLQNFAIAILYLLPALVIAISFHEFAHAWMANKMGDPTAKNLGRMTLDPTKHFDVWGFFMIILVGFGWGKPVPTNSGNFHNYKKGNALVALAGVTMNLILSFIFFGIFVLLLNVFGVDNEVVLNIILYIIELNIVLCIFNLIPIPPLDGHHLIKGGIAKISPNFYMAYQRYGFIVLIAIMMFTDWLSIALSFLSGLVLQLYSMFFGLFF